MTIHDFNPSPPTDLSLLLDALDRLEHRQERLIHDMLARLERLEQYAVRSSGVIAKRDQKLVTNCKHGHSLADAYVYYGKRFCRTCVKERSRTNYQAAKTLHEMFGEYAEGGESHEY